jgi:hypothetical protein
VHDARGVVMGGCSGGVPDDFDCLSLLASLLQAIRIKASRDALSYTEFR